MAAAMALFPRAAGRESFHRPGTPIGISPLRDDCDNTTVGLDEELSATDALMSKPAFIGSELPSSSPMGSPPAALVNAGVLTPRAEHKERRCRRSMDDSDSSSRVSECEIEDESSMRRRERTLFTSTSSQPPIKRSGSSLKSFSSFCETGRLNGSFDQLEQAHGNTEPSRRNVTWGTRETFTIEGLETWSLEEKQDVWWNNKEFGNFVAAELKRRREWGVESNRALNPESDVWVDTNPIPLSEKDKRWWEADDESNGGWGFWEGMFGPSDAEPDASPTQEEHGIFETIFGKEGLFGATNLPPAQHNRSTF